ERSSDPANVISIGARRPFHATQSVRGVTIGRLMLLSAPATTSHVRAESVRSKHTREMVMERKKASDFPQELLNLFDEYVHGGISRRQFLDSAQKFAVGGLTTIALLEMLKPNYALAVQVQPNDPRITSSRETVQSPQGNGSIKGYLVKPANVSG